MATMHIFICKLYINPKFSTLYIYVKIEGLIPIKLNIFDVGHILHLRYKLS